MIGMMRLSVSQEVAFCCPSCRGSLIASPEAYRCAACERSYLVGIPDFRLAPDPYISLAEEYEKIRLLAEEANRRSFEDMVRFYWDITPDVPRELGERYIGYAVEGERRGHVYLLEVDTRCAYGSWGGQRPSLGGYVTVTGPRTGRPPPKGVHVDYAPIHAP